MSHDELSSARPPRGPPAVARSSHACMRTMHTKTKRASLIALHGALRCQSSVRNRQRALLQLWGKNRGADSGRRACMYHSSANTMYSYRFELQLHNGISHVCIKRFTLANGRSKASLLHHWHELVLVLPRGLGEPVCTCSSSVNIRTFHVVCPVGNATVHE